MSSIAAEPLVKVSWDWQLYFQRLTMESKECSEDQGFPQLPRTPSPSRRQSQTLPHSFEFHYDEHMTTPKTPQPQITSTPPMPAPPEPPKVRVKKRRPTLMTHDIPPPSDSTRCVTPSIELSAPGSSNAVQLMESQEPQSRSTGTVDPAPFTPLCKLQTSLGYFRENLRTPEPWSASQFSKGESITRPSSAWSELSDSSVSSMSSFGTSVTKGESMTSPESESTDPFVEDEAKSALLPSALSKDRRTRGRRVKKHIDAEWSPEMDDHLWLSYMTYLSDPTVTPFKTLPGTAPPLGVCHRVARRAKTNWKGPRTTLGTVEEDATSMFASIDANLMQPEPSLPVADSPETIKHPIVGRSLSAGARRNPAKWPFSNSATRRRLRELCKHKSALSPHYQRLMHSRSPSPIDSSSSQGHHTSSPKQGASDHSTFSTRHMNMMLTTSTASSMQPGNPLSQLASSSPRTPRRSTPHVKSSSMQSTFGINNEQQHQEGLASLRRLASPFQEKPRDGTVVNATQYATSAAPTLRPSSCLQTAGPLPQQRRLASPLEIHQPRPMSASMKRRAQYQLGEELLTDDPEVRMNFLEETFRDPATASGKRRVRSRGFSLGAVRNGSGSSRQGSRQLSELFTPPTTTDAAPPSSSIQQQLERQNTNLGTPFQPHLPSQLRAAPTFGNDAARRLGSPFAPVGNVGMSNTFPRSLFPQGLDRISSLESPRQQQEHETARPDVQMEDPFVEPVLESEVFGSFAQSSSGTIRRRPRP